MKTKPDTKVARTRNTIISFAVVVAILIIGYGTLYSTGVTQGEFVAGEHYREMADAPRRHAGDTIVVREFFSYACIHCRNLDPMIEDWLETLPDGVSFERSPVAFGPIQSILAQTYHTLENTGSLAENHTRIFRAIHDNGRQFLSGEMLANFVDGHGVDKAEFLRTFNSPKVRRALQQGEADQRKLVIASIPTLIVADKYVVNMDSGRKTALDIVDHLVAMEQTMGTAADNRSGNEG